MRYARTTRLTLLLLATLVLLGGCGQKGPLYLPDEEQQEET
ncbi:MAG: lipoprotein [Gammaproteobacteria bacterium]|jgi:predicted small lipoprotein YifL